MAKKKAKKKASRSKKMDMLLVGSKTKDALKRHKVNIAGDALDGLNGWIYWLIEQGATRAKANGRKTVRAHDFLVM